LKLILSFSNLILAYTVKSCITDWANHFPAHVVKQWAGHSDLDTTDRYYLQVSEADYEKAAAMRMSQETTQLPTQLAENEANLTQQKNAESSQTSPPQELPEQRLMRHPTRTPGSRSWTS